MQFPLTEDQSTEQTSRPKHDKEFGATWRASNLDQNDPNLYVISPPLFPLLKSIASKFFVTMNTKKVIKERHKRWGTQSPWLVEFWCNAVSYCKTSEGNARLESWVRDQYGSMAAERLDAMRSGPLRRYGSFTGNRGTFNKAASELGVADEFLIQAYHFAAYHKMCVPERTTPAPVRKRGEASSTWLARCSEATMAGAKIPNINWAEMRRIAFSEYDHIRDQMEVWRTRPDMFVKGLVERAHSTIIFDHHAESERFHQACMDALRSRMHISHIQYAAWSQAATLFEELDKKGLTTSASVMRAIKMDRELLGRVTAMVCHVIELERWWSGKLPQVLTSCKAIRPYFIRKRLPTGSAVVITDAEYCRRNPPKNMSIEFVLTGLYETVSRLVPAATHLREIHKATRDPKEAQKLTAEAYDTIGDYAIAAEFTNGFTQSFFGEELIALVKEAIQDGTSKSWFPFLSGMDQDKMTEEDDEPHNTRFGSVESLVRAQGFEWLNVCFSIDAKLAVTLMVTTDTWGWREYDTFWHTIDQLLWQGAERLERAPGSLAKLFGLFDPEDKSRPTAGEAFLRQLTYLIDLAEELFRPETAPDQPFVSSIPVATPQDSVAKAPERGSLQPKVKVKKKKAKASQSTESPPPLPPQVQPIEVPEEEELDENLPELLPKNWKLNKRAVDLFHRLLDHSEKSGSIRWADFETAMKQIGFKVTEADGSSVRFDPPAKHARPITFHRPHPDPTLTPSIIKWVGARLKRCYGWTASTFAGEVE